MSTDLFLPFADWNETIRLWDETEFPSDDYVEDEAPLANGRKHE